MGTSESLGPLSLCCETLGLGTGLKSSERENLSLRCFERDIQDITCYTGSLSDCEEMYKLQGVNIMMMWVEEAAAFTTDKTI